MTPPLPDRPPTAAATTATPTTATPTTATGTRGRLDRRLVAVMATISGLVVANSYYAQPLVGAIAAGLDAPESRIGLVVTASQVGYALGLAFLVPLGDLVERRRLLYLLLAFTACCLLVMAASPSWSVLAAAAVLVGVGSVVGQILVPFAAELAGDDERGQVIGSVMTGLLSGILLSRVVAGLIAEVVGWRGVFVVAAALVVGAGLLVRTLPVVRPPADGTYRAALASVVRLVATEPVLRLRIAYGTLTYASFGVFWTSVGFLLAGRGWSDAQIGLFTLVGVAGALAARFAGGLADRGFARLQTGPFVVLTALSFVPLALGEHHIVALAVGVALLDLGIQGTHISNQSLVYPLRPGARSRLNTAYMSTYFVAGAVGSALSTLALTAGGWGAVCALGALFPTVGAAVWCVETARSRRTTPREMPTAPRDIDTAPRDIDTAPRNIDTAPRNIDTAPRNIDTAPRDIDTGVGEVDSGAVRP